MKHHPVVKEILSYLDKHSTGTQPCTITLQPSAYGKVMQDKVLIGSCIPFCHKTEGYLVELAQGGNLRHYWVDTAMGKELEEALAKRTDAVPIPFNQGKDLMQPNEDIGLSQGLEFKPYLQITIRDAVPMTHYQWAAWVANYYQGRVEIPKREEDEPGYLIKHIKEGEPNYLWAPLRTHMFKSIEHLPTIMNANSPTGEMTFVEEDLPLYCKTEFLEGLTVRDLRRLALWLKTTLNARTGALGVTSEVVVICHAPLLTLRRRILKTLAAFDDI